MTSRATRVLVLATTCLVLPSKATPPASVGNLEHDLVGIWQSSNPAFDKLPSDATNALLRVHQAQVIPANPNPDSWRAELSAELVVQQRDGREEPVIDANVFVLTQELLIGVDVQNVVAMKCAFTNQEICLERTSSGGETWFRTKLRKVKRAAETPMTQPAWAPAWRDLERIWVGRWEGIEFATEFYELSGATNLVFKVFTIDPVAVGQKDKGFGNMMAFLLVRRKDGTEGVAPDSVPVTLREKRISFYFPDGYGLYYSFTNNFLILSNSSPPIRAKLRKISKDPGDASLLLFR